MSAHRCLPGRCASHEAEAQRAVWCRTKPIATSSALPCLSLLSQPKSPSQLATLPLNLLSRLFSLSWWVATLLHHPFLAGVLPCVIHGSRSAGSRSPGHVFKGMGWRPMAAWGPDTTSQTEAATCSGPGPGREERRQLRGRRRPHAVRGPAVLCGLRWQTDRQTETQRGCAGSVGRCWPELQPIPPLPLR